MSHTTEVGRRRAGENPPIFNMTLEDLKNKAKENLIKKGIEPTPEEVAKYLAMIHEIVIVSQSQ